MKGTIFNIQKFCINDGPGIRTTVFLKGCPLKCIWCHNPESQSAHPELMYAADKCVKCRRCFAVCKCGAHKFTNDIHSLDRESCRLCMECVRVCPVNALEVSGKITNVKSVIDEVLKDKKFYDNSGGGITISGGEPMFQFEFTKAILKEAKSNGIHTCIETSGYAPKEHYKEIAPLVDLFLFDYKETDPEKHKKYVGAGNELILENIFMLDSMGAEIILRCPIIPTINDREEHLTGIAELADKLKNIIEINVEPYHTLGKSKAEKLGREYLVRGIDNADDELIKKCVEFIGSHTAVPVKRA